MVANDVKTTPWGNPHWTLPTAQPSLKSGVSFMAGPVQRENVT